MNYNKFFFDENNSSLNIILKIAGKACNINCDYCFEKIKEVSDDEFVTPEFIEDLFSKIESDVNLVLHGGEPLVIGLKRMDKILFKVKEYYGDKIKTVKLQTNGTLITDKWLDLFYIKYAELNIEIAISLDGDFDINYLRYDYKYKTTFHKVKNAFSLLEKRGISAGMLSVISKNTVKKYSKYLNILEEIPNIKFIKLNPLFNVVNNKLSKDSITPLEYTLFIIRIAKLYIENKLYKKLAIEPLLSMLQKAKGKRSRYCNFTKGKCYQFITVYPDGLTGPCDCFSASEFKITHYENETIENDIKCHINLENTSNIIELHKLINFCKNCDIYEFCTGGCLSQRYNFRNNPILVEEYCKSRKMLYEFFVRYFR